MVSQYDEPVSLAPWWPSRGVRLASWAAVRLAFASALALALAFGLAFPFPGASARLVHHYPVVSESSSGYSGPNGCAASCAGKAAV